MPVTAENRRKTAMFRRWAEGPRLFLDMQGKTNTAPPLVLILDNSINGSYQWFLILIHWLYHSIKYKSTQILICPWAIWCSATNSTLTASKLSSSYVMGFWSQMLSKHMRGLVVIGLLTEWSLSPEGTTRTTFNTPQVFSPIHCTMATHTKPCQTESILTSRITPLFFSSFFFFVFWIKVLIQLQNNWGWFYYKHVNWLLHALPPQKFLERKSICDKYSCSHHTSKFLKMFQASGISTVASKNKNSYQIWFVMVAMADALNQRCKRQ